jgi:hypothetical protein
VEEARRGRAWSDDSRGTTNPHGKTKSTIYRLELYLDRPCESTCLSRSFLKSELVRFGLAARVGGREGDFQEEGRHGMKRWGYGGGRGGDTEDGGKVQELGLRGSNLGCGVWDLWFKA